jgi:hypothetical protein
MLGRGGRQWFAQIPLPMGVDSYLQIIVSQIVGQFLHLVLEFEKCP